MRKYIMFLMLSIALVGCTGKSDDEPNTGDNDTETPSPDVDVSGESINGIPEYWWTAPEWIDDLSFGDDYDGDTVAETVDTDDEDCVENYSTTIIVNVTFATGGASVSSQTSDVTASVEGNDVTINSKTAGVEYVLSGTATDGMMKIYSTKKFKLTLNGVTINNADAPALNIQSTKRAYIVVADNTVNTLSDGTSYTSGEEDMKGCIFSEGKLIFSGGGTLNINGNVKHGICSDDYVKLRKGVKLNVTSTAKDGIHANDEVVVSGGTIIINSAGDGIECEEGSVNISGGNITINSADDAITASYADADETITPDVNISGGKMILTTTGDKGMAIKSEGKLTISGGVIKATVVGKASKALKCGGDMTVSGGRMRLVTTGDAYYDSDEKDITSPAGVNCDGNLLFSEGEMTVLGSGSAGKGVSCNGETVINSGTIRICTTGGVYKYGNLDSSAKGLKSDGNLTINGGEIDIKVTGGTQTKGSEGIESKGTLTIAGGTIRVYACDDAINATKEIVVSGGHTYCYSIYNDGMDSNGTFYFSGGVTVSSGATQPEEGFDCDQNNFKITGGTLVGMGGATSNPTSSSCTQHSVICNGLSVAQNQYLNIQDSDGKSVLIVRIPRAYNSMTLLFSSSELGQNKNYSLYTGGDSYGGEEWCGLYTSSLYAGGTLKQSFTTAAMVTTVGTSSGMGGGGGRH